MNKASVLFIVSLLVNNISAAIHYTYVGDQVNSSSARYYDVDLDGDNDFHFTEVDLSPSTSSVSYHVNSTKPSSFYAAATSDSLPKAYAFGAGLGTYQWQNEAGLLFSPTGGYFTSNTKYLMVKFSDGSNAHYGWFEIRTSAWIIVIESFAYSDVPDEIIAAGETDPTVIQNINQPSFNLVKLDQHQIAFQNCEGYDKVSVYTLEGKTVTEITHPIAFQNYSIEQANGILMVAFFRNEKLLYSTRHFVQYQKK